MEKNEILIDLARTNRITCNKPLNVDIDKLISEKHEQNSFWNKSIGELKPADIKLKAGKI